MEEERRDRSRRRSKRRRTSGTTVIVWLLVLLVVIAVIVWGVWKWMPEEGPQADVPEDTASEVYQVQIRLSGDEQITLEYGDPFTDPGAEAWGYDTVRDTEPVAVEVRVEGLVEPRRLGSYTLTYTAEYQGVTQSVTRTVEVVDTTPPTITLVTDPNLYTIPGQPYQEEGYTATDECDGDLTDSVYSYEEGGVVYYSVTDSSGNTAQIQRTVNYHDPVAPELTLRGDTRMSITAGTVWNDPGYTATDNVDGDLTGRVKISGKVERYVAGTYVLTYEVSDSYGNKTTAQRTVVVKKVSQPEVVEPSGKVIYLTFDDGPWSDTDELLEVLEKYNVKATFFVINNTKFIDLLDDIAAGGHAIGIHSKTHKYDQIYASDEAFFEDLYAMQDIIYEHTGIKTTLMRFPGGSSNGVSKKYNPGIMTRLVVEVESLGFQYFDWNVDSDDAGGATTAEEVFQNVVAGVSDKEYSVVLQHDSRSFSVAAVEQIICWGLENGYTFLPLDATSPTCHHTWMNN